MYFWLAFLAVCLVGAVGVSMLALKEEKERRQYTKKSEKKKNEIVEVEKIDLETLQFAIDFKSEFNMSFFDFLKDYRDQRLEFISLNIDAPDKFRFYRFSKHIFSDKEYIMVIPTVFKAYMKPEEVLLNSLNNDKEFLENLEKATLDGFKSILHPYSDLEYVKYIEVKTTKTIEGKKYSNLELAVTENLFGTAAAINKIQQHPPETEEEDKSYILFCFSKNSGLGGVNREMRHFCSITDKTNILIDRILYEKNIEKFFDTQK